MFNNRRQANFRKQLKALNPTVQIEGDIFINGPIKHLTLGDHVQFAHNCYLHLGGYEWCENKGKLIIGEHASFGPNVVLYGTGPYGIEIGKHFDCGPAVHIYASRTNLKDIEQRVFAPVKIGNQVTLFSHTVVSPGVDIGNHVVVAANSVVTKSLPDHCFAGGSPAKIIKDHIRP